VQIAGGGINESISTSDRTAIRLALDGGTSAEDQFNRQFVAAQLNLLAAPELDQAALRSKLSCYGINFAPVALSQGTAITPNTTLGTLMDLARSTARSSSGADLTALGNLFAQFNGNCKRFGQ